MLSIEEEIQSLKGGKGPRKDWIRERYEQLALIDEKRMKARYHAQGYQTRRKCFKETNSGVLLYIS